jgi:methionyl-tRNA formyltransferase
MTPNKAKSNNAFTIVFMGTPDFAVPSLTALLDHGENVVAVVTQPDRPKGRGRKLTAPPVKQLALDAGLPVLQPEKIRGQDFLAQLKDFQPDLIVVTAYGRILPGRLLNMPPLGTINVHGSLLPKYRGAAPVQWAILNGDSETGVTIMQMDEGMDTGDILLTRKIPIGPDDTAATLMTKLADLGGRALTAALGLLRDGKLAPTRQDENLATTAPPLVKTMGLVDWSKPAAEISCQIRGMDPWPTTYTSIAGKRFRLFRPTVIDDQAAIDRLLKACPKTDRPIEPGTLCRVESDGLIIATGKGFLHVQEVQPEGSRRMTVGAYLSGHSLAIGQILGQTSG